MIKKINGKEVTPFLNKLFHSKSTYSFDNFFHQVGQGKTSDAENMLETSTFGLPQGSLFTQFGSDNTFQAAPAILNQQGNYTSAVFHGNVASFWNRNNVYKNMGYQYFFLMLVITMFLAISPLDMALKINYYLKIQLSICKNCNNLFMLNILP